MHCIISIQLLLNLTCLFGWPAESNPGARSVSVCENPLVNSISPLSESTGKISWIDFNSLPGKTYELDYAPFGQSPDGVPEVTGISGLSHTIENLESGTRYSVFIRSNCEGEYANWNGPYLLTTHILNASTSCTLNLPIEDNNCPNEQVFPIVVNEYGGYYLGEEVFIQSVSVTMEHSWVADMSLYLESPAGSTIRLSEDHGVGEANLGSPNDPECTMTLNFTMDACSYITEDNSPYIGNFLPDEDYQQLHDGSAVSGLWKLRVCDKAQGDAGILRHVKIHFVDNICLLAPSVQIVNVFEDRAIFLLANSNCEDIRLSYGSGITEPENLASVYQDLACEDTLFLNNLDPGTEYSIFFQNLCGQDSSNWSCLYSFTTDCHQISLLEDFDEKPLCEALCGEPCLINGNWKNIDEDDGDWTVWSGPTPTNFTGPDGDVFGRGQYLYLESSAQECQDSAESILLSECLRFESNADGCDLSFWYHMMGADIGNFSLEVSLDDARTWQSLFNREGQQSSRWEQVFIDLAPFDGRVGKLRFRGQTGSGSQGDIAIDAIRFYGSSLADSSALKYFIDSDLDGYGTDAQTLCLCSSGALEGSSTNADDCNDSNPDIHPDAMEIPCNLSDENCNGMADDLPEDPPQIQMLELQDASCPGIANGVLEIAASGPFSPYTYDWGEGLPDTGRLENLPPGNYQATITDVNGCVSISNYFAVDIEETIVYHLTGLELPTCPGLDDGAITGTIIGGNGPYTYAWNTGDTTLNLDGIGNGTYLLEATDQEGCVIQSEPIVVNANETFQVGVSKKNPTCSGLATGTIQLLPFVGTPPYTYIWSSGETAQSLSGLSAGNYIATIEDASGCQVITDTILLVDPQILEVNISGLDAPSCAGGNDGSIQIRVRGGTPPYFYQWSTGQLTDDLYYLEGGFYSVTVTDFKGCQSMMENIFLEEPPAITIKLDSLAMARCPGDNSGYIGIDVSGGTPPYQYFWNTGEENTDHLENLNTGFYAVSVSDANGCKAKLNNIQITPLNDPIEIQLISIDSLKCFGDSTASIEVVCTGGSSPYWFNWNAGQEHFQSGNKDTLQGLARGTYRVTVTDVEGCTGVLTGIQVTQPPRMQYSQVSIVHNLCSEAENGAIQLTLSGGVKPYTYEWSNGMITENIGSLPAGIYQLEAEDANGCQLRTPNFTVFEEPRPTISFDMQPSSGGQNNGAANAMVDGENPPYSFLWDDNAGASTSSMATNLGPGWYSLSVTDGLACTYVDSVFIEIADAVEEGIDESRYRIFPNPATEEVHILIESTVLPSISVSGLDGRMLRTDIRRNHSGYVIDLRELPQGYYLIRIENRLFSLVKINR